MGEEDFGLERILDRKRFFLIDTNVIFGGTSGDSYIQDDTLRLAADLSYRKRRLQRMKAIFDVIRMHDNVRLTREVRAEFISKLGRLKSGYHDYKKKERLIQKIDHYFRKHQELVLGVDYWRLGPLRQVGWLLQAEMQKRHPELKDLSNADISLLVKALEVRLADNSPYQKTDIVSADYGIVVGAQVLFSVLPTFTVATPKELRRVQYRCIKIISRHYPEDYHDVFDSVQYCIGLRRALS